MSTTDEFDRPLLLKHLRGLRRVMITHPEEKPFDVLKTIPEFLARTGHYAKPEDRIKYFLLMQTTLYLQRDTDRELHEWTPSQMIIATTKAVDLLESQ